VTPEEWLYPQVQEALSAWTITYRPHHVVYRIVGEQWAPRSHDLREMLSRNGVPFAFYSVDSTEGQQLLRDFSVDPAVLRPSSATTVQCSTTRVSPTLCTRHPRRHASPLEPLANHLGCGCLKPVHTG
jgi:hypothetical protein